MLTVYIALTCIIDETILIKSDVYRVAVITVHQKFGQILRCLKRLHLFFISVLQLLRDYFTQTLPSSDIVRYPIAFLHLTVPSADVDVNLEPNKSRVLLQNKVPLFVYNIFSSVVLVTVWKHVIYYSVLVSLHLSVTCMNP